MCHLCRTQFCWKEDQVGREAWCSLRVFFSDTVLGIVEVTATTYRGMGVFLKCWKSPPKNGGHLKWHPTVWTEAIESLPVNVEGPERKQRGQGQCKSPVRSPFEPA